MNKKNNEIIDNYEIEVFSRQAYMFTKTQLKTKRVIGIGLGFVGSNLIYSLNKTGFRNFELYDFDKVGKENILNQVYLKKHIGMNKTEALKQKIKNEDWTDGKLLINNYNRKFDINKDIIFDGDIVIISTDNRESKLSILEGLYKKRTELKNTIIILVNTNSDIIQMIFSKNQWGKIKKEIESLKNVKEVSTGLCGEKSAFYLGNLISGLSISYLRNSLLRENSFEEELFYLIKYDKIINKLK